MTDRFEVRMRGDSVGSGRTYRQVTHYDVVDTQDNDKLHYTVLDRATANDVARVLNNGV